MNLEETRKQIDELDQVLVETFEKRLAAVLNIAKIKEAENIKIYDPERETKVLEKGLAYVNDPSLRDYVKHFLNDVMAVSRSYQKDHIQQHIFLVGMPGAGKTTVGKALAQRQDMDFYDVDALIQENTGKSIQNVIIYEGEEAFRE
uniref:chorismate mutase n=1 Tax=Veillonella magna TaxID=464322 RepID=UPI00402ADE9E